MCKQTIFEFKLRDENWEIKLTYHAWKRINERFDDIDEFTLAGDIIALGEDRLNDLIDREGDCAIIDEDRDLSIIVSFDEARRNWIKIITTIDKSDIFTKKGTKVERL